MPIFYPRNRPSLFSKRIQHAALLLTLAYSFAPAQTLAHPGWAGSGITPQTWWRRAVFYRIDGPTLPSAEQLPSLPAFGFEAIILTPAAMTPQPASDTTGNTQPLSLDDLFSQCSRLHVHVLVPLDLAAPNTTPESTLALAKSLLYRGASGFVLTGLDKLAPTAAEPIDPSDSHHHRQTSTHSRHLPKSAEPQLLVQLQSLLLKFSSDKILVSATPAAFPDIQLQIISLPPATAPGETVNAHTLLSLSDPATLTPIDATRLLLTPAPAVIDGEALPAALLAKVFPPPAQPIETAPAPPPPPPPPPANIYGTYVPYVSQDTPEARHKKAAEEAAAKEAATIAAETFPVQSAYDPISETPVGFVAFYHRLVQLHQSTEALPDGTVHEVTAPSPALAWAVTHAGASPLVVVLNPTSSPQHIDLTTSLRGIVTPRLAFRTLSHTAASSGVVHPDKVEIGPNGVYAGELVPGYVYR